MVPMNLWLVIPTGLAAIAWIGLVVWYQIRAKWWKTSIGKNTMGVSFIIALSMVRLFVLQVTLPYTEYKLWETILGVFVYSSLSFLGVQRIVFVEQSQREATRRSERLYNRRWD